MVSRGETRRAATLKPGAPAQPDPMATQWKMPPLIKVYEALGALGDGRVQTIDEHNAAVASSEGTKVYQVHLGPGSREVSSNDNASYWQGYLGYPAIAVLMLRGAIEQPAGAAQALAAIPWKELNRRLRNDWSKTLAEVERQLAERGHDPAVIRAQAQAVLEALRAFAPDRSARHRPPAARA